jgi:hypothetical protein
MSRSGPGLFLTTRSSINPIRHRGIIRTGHLCIGRIMFIPEPVTWFSLQLFSFYEFIVNQLDMFAAEMHEMCDSNQLLCYCR